MNEPFKLSLPCGLTLQAHPMPSNCDRDGQWQWTLDTDAGTVARGYVADRATALVCLRWAATSCMQRSLDLTGATLEKAL